MLKQFSILVIICFSSLYVLAQKQEITDQPQISSKPEPASNNKTEKKKIVGTVRLRVTFLASGEIGDIVFVSENSKNKKLIKNGLVEQAIEAAKKIKFQPAKKNGEPVTVVKIIEYSFSIY